MYVGLILFAAMAVLVILAWLGMRQKRKSYERGE